MKITDLDALEILDSRGYPTVEVILQLDGEPIAASVPSGKSTGRFEALERRDGDAKRYGGKGVLGAVAAVREIIAPALVGRDLPAQDELDQTLIDLDGTPTKSRLGANAIVGVSIAGARARAKVEGRPLFQSLSEGREPILPVPCFNVINGGAHAPNELEFQEFMIVPAGRPTFAEAVRAGSEVYHALAEVLQERGLSTAVGDEGGFAPAVAHPAEALDLLSGAVERAGYGLGRDVFFALDPAANGFHEGSRYVFAKRAYDAAELTALYAEWLGRYPIISIEDGLAEDDVAGWRHLTRELGARVQLVGDDIFVSDPERVRRAAEDGVANAVLLKPNQIGTVSEIMATARAARSQRYGMMMSHRSGETDDAFIADLAVGLATGQIKSGAPARGERVAKYNRLMHIERDVGAAGRYGRSDVFRRQRR